MSAAAVMVTASDREARERVARLDTLLARLESLGDPVARAAALEAVQALLELYGEALGRIVGHVERAGGADVSAALIGDELVAHLLVLHDLHPVPVEARITAALTEVRPYLRSHGGDVELLGVDGGVAKLRLQGSCHGCPSSAVTLRLAVEEAVRRAAPELEGIEAEGAVAPASATDPALVPLTMGPRSAAG